MTCLCMLLLRVGVARGRAEGPPGNLVNTASTPQHIRVCTHNSTQLAGLLLMSYSLQCMLMHALHLHAHAEMAWLLLRRSTNIVRGGGTRHVTMPSSRYMLVVQHGPVW